MQAGADGDTCVAVVGAGPAGLVVANLLLAADVPCIVFERRTESEVNRRARAGFLAPNTVRVLTENGLASGLTHRGRRHDHALFRDEAGEFDLRYDELGVTEGHTVYPQQLLVRDLVAQFRLRGGDIRFGCEVNSIDGIGETRASIDAGGRRISARYVAGCDGAQGVARRSIPQARVVRHPGEVGWLAVLTRAPQSMPAETFSLHDRGLAAHMARTPDITRYYLQVEPGTQHHDWSADRIWAELHTRMYCDRFGALRAGPVLDRTVVDMRCEVLESVRHGRLLLAGDAAAVVNPTAAKGANLAVRGAELLAHAVISALVHHDERSLERYSAQLLAHIWRAQDFSIRMGELLHTDHAAGAYGRGLQRARLDALRRCRAQRIAFVTDYLEV